MTIKNENEINGVSVHALRLKLDMTQKAFWSPVCVSNTRGCAYETGKTAIPAPVRRLLYLHYVLGIPADISGGEMGELAKVAAPARRAKRQMEAATKLIEEAGELLKQAKGVMNASIE